MSKKKKKSKVAILIMDKVDFKTKAVTRDKEGHYIIIKGTIQQEYVTIVNIYAPNITEPKYIKQLITKIKKLIYSNIIIVGEINTLLTKMDSSSKQKIDNKIVALNDTLAYNFS